jgi:hypothetical protein
MKRLRLLARVDKAKATSKYMLQMEERMVHMMRSGEISGWEMGVFGDCFEVWELEAYEPKAAP